MVDRVSAECHRFGAQGQADRIQQGGQIGHVAVLAAVAQHQRLAEAPPWHAQIVMQQCPDARYRGQRRAEHFSCVRAFQGGSQWAEALLACQRDPSMAFIAEHLRDARLHLQQAIEQVGVIGVDCTGIGCAVVGLHDQRGQFDGRGRAGGEAAAVLQRGPIGRCQMAGSERGGAALRVAHGDPARRQRGSAEEMAAGLDEIDGVARGGTHVQVGMVTRAAQALVIGGNDGIALSQELVEEAAIALGLIGAGYRRRAVVGDALGAVCPGHHRPATCRRRPSGQVDQPGGLGQATVMIGGAVGQLVGLGGLGGHPAGAVGRG
ncbi:hypothetical protein D3C72_1198000 [compost metagenome]